MRLIVCTYLQYHLIYPTLVIWKPYLSDHLLWIPITKVPTITPELSNAWFIQHLVYPSPGLSNTWFIQHLVYPTPGLSNTWFIQHLVYPTPGLSNAWFLQLILWGTNCMLLDEREPNVHTYVCVYIHTSVHSVVLSYVHTCSHLYMCVYSLPYFYTYVRSKFIMCVWVHSLVTHFFLFRWPLFLDSEFTSSMVNFLDSTTRIIRLPSAVAFSHEFSPTTTSMQLMGSCW